MANSLCGDFSDQQTCFAGSDRRSVEQASELPAAMEPIAGDPKRASGPPLTPAPAEQIRFVSRNERTS